MRPALVAVALITTAGVSYARVLLVKEPNGPSQQMIQVPSAVVDAQSTLMTTLTAQKLRLVVPRNSDADLSRAMSVRLKRSCTDV